MTAVPAPKIGALAPAVVGGAVLYLADCLPTLRAMPDASVDAIVTDPPAGIGFMGKTWDTPGSLVERKPNRSVAWDRVGGNHNPADSADKVRTNRVEGRRFREWLTPIMVECLRVLKPGGHALVWAIPRTSHWTGIAVEDAGFEIRDRISHLTGQGFPKSLNLEGEWAGWGTALKPGAEDWWLTRKPLSSTVAANVAKYGTGAMNIDGCRIGTGGSRPLTISPPKNGKYPGEFRQGGVAGGATTQGRWPANIILGEDAAAELDAENGIAPPQAQRTLRRLKETTGWSGGSQQTDDAGDVPGDAGGGPSRFYYCPKSPKSDRGKSNKHPTVKNTDLMRWLCRLVTPPGGTVLDCFMGSGSTGVAAVEQGFKFIGIEQHPDYFQTARQRIANAQPPLIGGAA